MRKNAIKQRLVFVSFLVTASAVMYAQSLAGPPAFEVATVKPHGAPSGFMGGSCHGTDTAYPPDATMMPPLGRCVLTQVNLTYLLSAAYAPAVPNGVPQKITGGPSWAESEFWDIQGKADDSSPVTRAQLIQMLQTLLADRFKLQFHREAKEVPGFILVVARNGLKIVQDQSDTLAGMSVQGRDVIFRKTSLSSFANFLSGPAGAQVIDKTGLTGNYSFTYSLPPRQPATSEGTVDNSLPSVFTILQEQFGLRLESQKVPVEVLVIDHAERP